MNHILQRLSSPWAIEPQWLRVAWGVGTRGRIDAAALAKAKADWDARRAAGPKMEEPGAPVEGTGGTLRIVGNVGVLSIEGPLFRHADMFTDISGGTSYNALWRGLEAALASPQVAAILLRINSPGGEVDGLYEFAEGVRAAGDNKLVWMHGDNIVASAAAIIGMQARRVVLGVTCEVGSFGVITGLTDDSKADEMAGIREIQIVSSQSPKKRSRPVDDEVIGRIQARMDDLAGPPLALVASARGVTVEEVIENYGNGNVMIASKAMAAGLADEIGDFNSTLAALSGAATTSNPAAAARAYRGAKMSTTSNPAAAAAPRAGDEPPTMRCSGGDADMTGKKGYCATCYDGDDHEEPDGDEEAKALAAAGLLGAKRSETRAKLVAFARAALDATGAPTAAAALARLVDNVTAATTLAQLRAEVDQERASTRAETVSKGLAAAISTGRVTIGRVCKEVPLLLGSSKGAARAALEAIPETLPQSDEDKKLGRKAQAGWSAPNVVKALSSVPITAEAAESIAEWLEAQATTALPPPAAQVPAGHPAANEAMNAARPTTAGQIPDVSFADEARKMREEGKQSR